LAQATPVLKARKPLFIDKPLAASLGDALQIMNLATENKTPVFSCSSLRFGKKIRDLRSDVKVWDILGCMTFGPCSVAEHHPDLSF
jgi:predicted dehydrogenase